MTLVTFQFGVAAFLGIGCRSPERAIVSTVPAVSVHPSGQPSPAAGPPHQVTAAVPPASGQVVSAAVLGAPVAAIQPASAISQEGTVPIAVSGAPFAVTVFADTIDIGVALRLAGLDNPTINYARERVEEAAADALAARALLLPNVNVGGNYRRHHGALETSFGYIRRVDSQSLYAGLGADTVGTGSVAFPGVRLFAHLGDAAYEPLAARQRLSARQSDAQAVQNGTLLAVVTAYLELVGAEARHTILRQGETDMAEVVRLAAAYAKAGQGRQAEASRAAANAALLSRQTGALEEEVRVTAAELARLLNLDPAIRLRTQSRPLGPMQLIPEEAELEGLVAEAVRTRPEVFARSAEVLEARVRVRQERVRPWVPVVSAGYSYGAFGGGSNLVTTEFGPLKGRSDFDLVAVWNFQNLGFGNRARTDGAEAFVGQAVARLDAEVNRIRREVAEAQAEARAAARHLEIVRPAVVVAEEGFRLDTARIRQGEGRPIELLDSFRQLLESRQELLRATVAFNLAQFRLFVAIGSNPLTAVPGR